MPRPLKNVTLRQLATFDALARLGSVSRTAQEMNLTQPAVSLQLAALEDSAGMPLLARHGRGVRLTEAGELLADYAGRILALWGEAGDAMATRMGHVAGTLRIGAVTTSEYLLPQLLLDFVQRHPQVRFTLRVGNRADIVGQLARQDVDLAIMGQPPSEPKVNATPFARHPMAFVAAPGHPLMVRPQVTLADVARANLLVREHGSGTRSAVERLFKQAGIELQLGAELSSNEAIKQMCAAGFGVAFISLHACVLELQAGVLALVPLPGYPIEREWYVIALAGRPQPAAAAAFAHFLVEQGQTLVEARTAGTLAQRLAMRADTPTAAPAAERRRAQTRRPTAARS
jgi:LysR family transcriptional regulator, low CO2-responsive transcriptional regulator